MDIKKLIETSFPDAKVQFDGEDCNSKLLIISEQFAGMSSLNRHKLIMSTLKDRFKSGELHALSLSTKTPSEVG
jgi:acid stress-induced BolA-like protein IbaG/YrbA